MNSNTLAVGLLVLIVGFGAGYFARGSQMPMAGQHMMPGGGMMHDSGMGMGGAMDSMTMDLRGKTGDEFDKAFLAGMIVHHEGAVEMAQMALQYAKHQEIKDMAQAIISAQTTEINQMKAWGKSWYNQ